MGGERPKAKVTGKSQKDALLFFRPPACCQLLVSHFLHGWANYKRPSTPVPAAFKELPPPDSPQASEWAPATPNDAIARGKWWEVYGDPELNALEEQVSISNQKSHRGGGSISRGEILREDCSFKSVPYNLP